MLCNIERANDVMDRHGLDGLIATHRINIYYLSDFWGAMMRIDRDFANFAVLPRHADRPAGLVVALPEIHQLVEAPTWIPNVVAFGRDPEAGHENALPELYPTRDGGDLTERERAWNAIVSDQRGKLQGTPIAALRRIVEDAGLGKARVGVDDLRVIGWLKELGLEIEAVDATNILREIRMIKTAEEIVLLRQAAEKNAAACEHALRAAHDGATLQELEGVFNEDWARQGGTGIYILLGSAGGMRHGRVLEGEPFMVDALGTFRHYHGDFGRTAVVGTPSPEQMKAYQAIRKGWEAARDATRPGVFLGDITARAIEVARREGFPEFHQAVAHSIGLEHTDNPVVYGNEIPAERLLLQQDMVVSLDMPHHELGWAHMHFEDTVRLTRDGCEPLTNPKLDLIQLPS